MSPVPSARLKLRAATAADHEQVDAAFAGLDLGDRARYARFLQAQASAFLPVEAGVDDWGGEQVLADWPARRRSPLLVADLAALGVPCEPPSDIPIFDGVEAVLGAVYVLEGSRLGGRLLARSVAQGLPRSFLDAGDPAMWRAFIAVLDATLVSEQQVTGAVEAAHAVFARFEASARRHS